MNPHVNGVAPLDLEGAAEEKAKPPGIANILGVGAIFAALPPIPWLCHGLRLCPGPPTLVAGYGYSAKTTLCQHIALCVAAGRSVFGQHSTERGGVLHLDYEQGDYLTRDKYQRIAKWMDITPEEHLGDRLHFVDYPDLYLDAPDAEVRLNATLDSYRDLKLLIIDSFRAACPKTDEQSSSARIPLDMLGRICGRRGIVPMVILHARKPKKEDVGGPRMAIRGSGSLYDACSGCYVLVGEKDEPKKVFHEKEKMRGVTIPTFAFDVRDEPFGDDPNGGLSLNYMSEGELTSSADGKEVAEAAKRVLAVVVAQPGQAMKTIRVEAQMGPPKVERALSHLVKTSHIEAREGKAKNGNTTSVYYPLRDAYEAPGLGMSAAEEDDDAEVREALMNV